MAPSVSARSAIVCLLGVALATGGCDRRSAGNGQAAGNVASASPDEAPPAGAAAPQAGAVDRSHTGEPPPAATFTTLDGKPATLAALTGKPLLVNLWATWCAPCVKELPTLEAAAAAAKGKVAVVAISQDMDPAKARAFLAQRRMSAITPYLDPQLGLSLALGANLPTTILYDAAGREVWRVAGDRDWTSAASRALIAER